MGERIKKLKKIRIHREGTNELTLSMLAIALIGTGLWYALDTLHESAERTRQLVPR